MLTYAGVGTPRDVDYEREKGSEFDFKYEFNISSRITGMYIIYIKFMFFMFPAASQVLSLLA